MNAMIDKNDLVFRGDKLHHVYEHTRKGSLLRKYFRDQFAIMADPQRPKEWLVDRKADLPFEFLVDVIGKLQRQRDKLEHTSADLRFIDKHRDRYLLKFKTKPSKS